MVSAMKFGPNSQQVEDYLERVARQGGREIP
jgi:hypothetical protein